MRFDTTALALAALVAPALAAQTWNVNIVDGMFEPAILDIAPGDTVRWPLNDGADHAIVQTVDGARSCISKIPGGFNSGRKTPGQAYQQNFREAGVVNYKDGIGANCLKGAVGTIFVGPRPDNSTETTVPPVAPTSTRAGSEPSSSVSATTTAAPSIATTTVAHTTVLTTISRVLTTVSMTPIPTPSNTPNAASGLSAQGSLVLGVAGLIGALVAF